MLILTEFRRKLFNYSKKALDECYDVDNPQIWKSVCINCNQAQDLTRPITCCFQILVQIQMQLFVLVSTGLCQGVVEGKWSYGSKYEKFTSLIYTCLAIRDHSNWHKLLRQPRSQALLGDCLASFCYFLFVLMFIESGMSGRIAF